MTSEELLCKLVPIVNGCELCKPASIDDSADLCKPTKLKDDVELCKQSVFETLKFVLSDISNEVDITRKQAAIIIHEFMRKVLLEEDESDVSAARELKDLYDCRVCVKHIEQMYVKGIMTPMIDREQAADTGLPVLFGGNELLSDDEAEAIVKRLSDKYLVQHKS